MKILYNSVITHIKGLTGELVFAYFFMAFAMSMFAWHIIDKIAAFTVISAEFQLIFT